MTATAIEGVVAAGRVPTWIIPAASITADPVTGTWSIPLTALTGAGTIKIDCYLDAGDIAISRTAQTRTRQRLCQTVAEQIKTGETIDITVSAVYDQQEASSATVNLAYSAVPEGAEVYVAQAFGWGSTVTPTAATVIDLWKGSVQMRNKNFPTSADEDLKFTATISGTGYFPDVALEAAVPLIVSVLPSGGAPGEMVTITGSRFTGTTGITIDAEAVVEFEVVSDTKIAALIPATVTAAADVVVTNAAGASAAYAYTAA
ncbi:hypothetical protein EOL73_04725 [Candidatus Saccharibacteria bacterium]|nr:hypothetical protein [Candidatus Saccharibacteria bacterium]